ncbi:Histidine permease YuiF [Campylobacter upsaliensis]|uniref:Histidine permease YuiF n=1 Tax=Campylobacter upsaliensis TaxID=28080 RepID=A0A448KL76_CAMUP|nr:Histidine permease YuiF [Campylobacter upsaliensis]
MGFIAFVMLVAAGYGEVLKQSGAVEELVNSVIPFVEGNKFLAIFAMLFIGLIIGTSFGTIPIYSDFILPYLLRAWLFCEFDYFHHRHFHRNVLISPIL